MFTMSSWDDDVTVTRDQVSHSQALQKHTLQAAAALAVTRVVRIAIPSTRSRLYISYTGTAAAVVCCYVISGKLQS
jgi:hypothetical protein